MRTSLVHLFALLAFVSCVIELLEEEEERTQNGCVQSYAPKSHGIPSTEEWPYQPRAYAPCKLDHLHIWISYY